MGILSDALEFRSHPSNPSDSIINAWGGGSRSLAGVYVNEEVALTFSAVWNAVYLISATIGGLPLGTFRYMTPSGKERVPDHPVYSLLHDAINPEITAKRWREAAMGHLLTRGNTYAEKVYDGAGRLREIWPIPPNRVRIFRYDELRGYTWADLWNREYGPLVYEVSMPNGPSKLFPRSKMLHIAGFGYDGIQGYSVIAKAKESLGLALGMEEFGARYFGNGTHPGLVVSHAGKLGPDGSKNLHNALAEAYSGLGKSHRLLLLEEAMKVEKIGFAPDESQFLESRKFSVEEVGRWFNIPLHKIKSLDKATFSNIEQQAIEFVSDCIQPWLITLEQDYNLQLFTAAERKQYFTKHNVNGLLRGDIKSRYDAYHQAIQDGWMEPDEIRELEDMNPRLIENLHKYLVPMNMVPANMAEEVARAQIAKKTEPGAQKDAPAGS